MKILAAVLVLFSASMAQARPVTLRNEDAKEMMETMFNCGLYMQTIDERTKRIVAGQLHCLFQTTTPEGFQQTLMCYSGISGVATSNPEAHVALLQKTRRYGVPYTNFGFQGFMLKSVVCDLRTDTRKFSCTINND
jgi:hypothetical protein